MGSARFSQDESQTVASQLVIRDGEHVAKAQAAGIADQNPCRQQDSVRAAQRTPRHLRGYRKQVTQFLVGPRPDQRGVGLDPAERPTYTLVHQEAVAESGLSQGVQHSAVILNGGRSQPMQSVSQIAVDPLLGQVADQPRQALGQDDQLLPVAGGRSHPRSVGGRVGNEGNHFCYWLGTAAEGEEYPADGTHLPPRKIATIPTKAPLAQLSSAGEWWGRATAALLPILSLAWWVLLALAIVVNASACAATLFLLGHLGRARSELRRVRLPRRGF